MRLFLGIMPDEAARTALWQTAQTLKATAPGRYVPPANYHLTLAFLGDAAPSLPGRLSALLQPIVAAHTAFPLTLGEIGMFGSVLWRGVLPDSPLAALNRDLRRALSLHHIPYDTKPLCPHITLARAVHAPLPSKTSLPDAAFSVQSVLLLESARIDGKLRYLPRTVFPLKLKKGTFVRKND